MASHKKKIKLQVGDRVLLDNGEILDVEEVRQTGVIGVVLNDFGLQKRAAHWKDLRGVVKGGK